LRVPYGALKRQKKKKDKGRRPGGGGDPRVAEKGHGRESEGGFGTIPMPSG